MKKKSLLTAVTMVAPIFLGANGVFAATNSQTPNPAQTTTSVTATLSAPTNGGVNPLPPQGPDSNQNDNTSNSVNGTFGIAYQPTTFNFGTQELSTTGNATYPAQTANNSKGFHVGVKDTTHDTAGWKLTATANGDIFTKGAKITTGSKQQIMKNENSNSGSFQQNKLVPVDNGSVTGTENAEITNVASSIMTGSNGSVFSSTYDIDLGNVSLSIPDVSKIQAGSVNGSVVWNLALTPQP